MEYKEFYEWYYKLIDLNPDKVSIDASCIQRDVGKEHSISVSVCKNYSWFFCRYFSHRDDCSTLMYEMELIERILKDEITPDEHKQLMHKYMVETNIWYRQNMAMKTAITETLEENLHLADGEDCTLIKLKRAIEE